MSTIRIFADLKAKYPIWNELKTFLTGVEGGNLNIIESNNNTVIIRYDKKTSNFQVPYVHIFRSVIWDTVNNLPISIAPFKASAGNPVVEGTLIQDFVEGVMIHVFHRHGDSDVTLATRTKLGAKTRFYSKRNFDELVYDSPQWPTIKSILQTPGNTFASLVLQHSENRIVAPVTVPRLYVISIGLIHGDGTVGIDDNPVTWPELIRPFAPETVTASTITTELMSNLAMQRGWTWQGLVIKNLATFQRWRLRNPIYTTVRGLRGSEADAYSRFLRLRHSGQLMHYVAYFPEDHSAFYEYEGKFRDQIRELFREYNAVHRGSKANRKNLKDVGWPLNKHVYILHGLYMTQLKPNHSELTIENVIQYVNTLPVINQRALLIAPVGGKKQENATDNTINIS